MVEKVYIEKHKSDNEWLNEYSFKAYEGFEKLGIETDTFISPGLMTPPYKDGVPISKDNLYVGSWNSLNYILNELDLNVPQYDYYPVMEKSNRYEKESLLCRRVETDTFGKAKDRVINFNEEVFIKPKKHKLFTGFVASCETDFVGLEDIDDDQEVWVSNPIGIQSEYRVFVHRGEIVSSQYYMGSDPLLFPNKTIVESMRDRVEIKEDISAYCFDVGVTTDGHDADSKSTLLIEFNDFYAIGCYGLRSVTYAKMLLDRWEQIINDY